MRRGTMINSHGGVDHVKRKGDKARVMPATLTSAYEQRRLD